MTDKIYDVYGSKYRVDDFKVYKHQLMDIIEHDRQRRYVEELSYITDKLGGF